MQLRMYPLVMVAIQVRDVPDAIRDELAREARTRGISMQTYLREVLEREARSARNREFLRTWTPVRGTGTGEPVDIAALIAADRAEREQHVLDAVTARSHE
jgi:hypothetical protein